jgi:predicted ATP-dependent endonuclease of OLD family
VRIEFVEIANFRKLRAVRVSFSTDKTVFVGANNSGKTSAMVALRYFLVPREQDNFTLNDFTLSGWPRIDAAGVAWEKAFAEAQPLPAVRFDDILPSLDLWLHVEDNEVHYVRKILPTLEWTGGRIGVRLRLEPKEPAKLQTDYLSSRADRAAVQQPSGDDGKAGAATPAAVQLWPESLTQFLERRLRTYFAVKAYVLDPAKYSDPEHGVAKPQALPEDVGPIDGDPFKGLIRIDEISAQRGFGQATAKEAEDDGIEGGVVASGTRKLSDQLRRYYNRHLDPYQKPESKDLAALGAIEEAQKAFDGRLKEGFSPALSEMEKLGYPGVTDPKLRISTRLRPVDGLNHEAAVQYIIQMSTGKETLDLRLPEDSNGLGYQNLISMVFKLMSFRDAWMRVGKAQSKLEQSEGIIAPLHLVLIEEPEAHLHTQVQQVFIRQAYQILRNHEALGKAAALTTQLVVSTHSSHIAHECEFSALRYFRRMPAKADDIPTSCVVNLTTVFGDDSDTKRFVTRYLKVTHCDLFFADAAVLIEGPAERILVPHFARSHDEFKALGESYITWLEIGGSHAHRLRELIEHLGLPTLIITDIDAIDKDGKAVQPQRLPALRSRNETLKTWCPSAENLIELLNKPAADKVKSYEKQQFAVRVAYQCPITIKFKDADVEAIANTLEDALVFQNLVLFAGLEGKGLISRFRKAIAESATVAELGLAIHEALSAGGKAELALDLLELKNEKAVQTPEYIREGLLWLKAELRRHQEDLGLPAGGADLIGAAA